MVCQSARCRLHPLHSQSSQGKAASAPRRDGEIGHVVLRQRLCTVVHYNKFYLSVPWLFNHLLHRACLFPAVAPSDPPRPGSRARFSNSCKYSGLLCLSLSSLPGVGRGRSRLRLGRRRQMLEATPGLETSSVTSGAEPCAMECRNFL